MFEELRASDEVVAAWHDVARRVGEALDRAGIPHHPEDSYPRPAGAVIGVDPMNDEMGGVIVDWSPGAALVGAVMESTRTGDRDVSAEQLYIAVTTAMRDAMLDILRASGFEVAAIDDSQRPPAVHVLRGP
ncbi:hypothetical protein [Actinoplanes sp. DH11]|uniref:hypothetical protein n=1 Tax=Actinoplanes sp. DH11 TaxID=2857011 RepID=UPI001E63B789|nr:hypothetical protein [Actinoplanes sp. DH11]